MPDSGNELEPFILLAKTEKGAAAANLITRVLEASSIYVFGELLDSPNLSALDTDDRYASAFRLLNLFAYGTYRDYDPNLYPPLTPPMKMKLRLLTIATLATERKILSYSDLQKELEVDSVRELEDLIIEGTNNGALRGKLDQKNSHFVVDFAIGRDVKKEDISRIIDTLGNWCESCDGMLTCLEHQVIRANKLKVDNNKRKMEMANKVAEIRIQLKAHQLQQLNNCSQDDPDSRMDVDRGGSGTERRKDTKNQGSSSKVKGVRGKENFWQK